MDGSSYNAWRVTSLSTLPGWAIAIACLALCFAIWLSFRGIRAEPSALRRRVLIGLRATAGLLLLILLLEPGVELRAESRVRARIALLLDTSRSMRFPAAPNGVSRAEVKRSRLSFDRRSRGDQAGRADRRAKERPRRRRAAARRGEAVVRSRSDGEVRLPGRRA